MSEPLHWPAALAPATAGHGGDAAPGRRAAEWPAALLAGHDQPAPAVRAPRENAGAGHAAVAAVHLRDGGSRTPPAARSPRDLDLEAEPVASSLDPDLGAEPVASSRDPDLGAEPVASSLDPDLGAEPVASSLDPDLEVGPVASPALDLAFQVEVGLEPYAALLDGPGAIAPVDLVLKACACVLDEASVATLHVATASPDGLRVGELRGVASASIAAIARARAAAGPPAATAGAVTIVDATALGARASVRPRRPGATVLVVGPEWSPDGGERRVALSAPADDAGFLVAVQRRLEQPLRLLYLD